MAGQGLSSDLPIHISRSFTNKKLPICFQPKDWLSEEYEIQSHPSWLGLPFLVHLDARTLGPSTLYTIGMTPIVPASKTDASSGVFTEKKSLSLKSWSQCLAFASLENSPSIHSPHSGTWQLLRQRSMGNGYHGSIGSCHFHGHFRQNAGNWASEFFFLDMVHFLKDTTIKIQVSPAFQKFSFCQLIFT